MLFVCTYVTIGQQKPLFHLDIFNSWELNYRIDNSEERATATVLQSERRRRTLQTRRLTPCHCMLCVELTIDAAAAEVVGMFAHASGDTCIGQNTTIRHNGNRHTHKEYISIRYKKLAN